MRFDCWHGMDFNIISSIAKLGESLSMGCRFQRLARQSVVACMVWIFALCCENFSCWRQFPFGFVGCLLWGLVWL